LATLHSGGTDPYQAKQGLSAIDEALKCKQTGEKKVIAFNLSGHGHFDMMAYEAYHKGELEDYEYPFEAVEEAMAHLPVVAY
jgi:hypothetical protein